MSQLASSPEPTRSPVAPVRLTALEPKLLRRAGPIVKWAGGKKRLLSEIQARLPRRYGRYFEPFFGGGALFFDQQPLAATLNDANAELTLLYRCVRDDVESLIDELQRHPYEKDHYYAMRAKDPETLSDIERAARTLYLNKTCFNGLYRVNRRGQFNVPMGRYRAPVICDEEKLRAASLLFGRTTITTGDYRVAVAGAKAGDFVYFDPPYQPISKTANFTSYTASGFGEPEQEALASVFRQLSERGVFCMLSNSDTPFIQELYGDFEVDVVEAPRFISRKASTRRPVNEVLVRNYPIADAPLRP